MSRLKSEYETPKWMYVMSLWIAAAIVGILMYVFEVPFN